MTAEEFGLLWDDASGYIEVQTSGSTGVPKKIFLSKHDMRVSADTTNLFFGLGAGSRFVCPMSFDFIGARMMLVRARQCGGILEVIPPSNSFTFEAEADLLAIVPSQVDALVENIRKPRNVIIGGAPLDAKRRKLLIDSQINAFTTYGMTETASHVALARIDSKIYNALPGVTFSLDERGCIVIDMYGRDVSHIVTNDLAELFSPTAFRWLGRYDNIINSGGIKINPEEIEAIAAKVLDSLGIVHTGLVVVPDESDKWGLEAVLKIETDSPISDSQLGRIRKAIKDLLPDPRKTPRQILTVTALPRTGSGKIARKI